MHVEIWYITGDGFHFGRHGLGQEESAVHYASDSLFAAVVTSLVALYGGDVVKKFGAPFLTGNPPFVLSSAYPRAGDLLFFPFPMVRKPPGETDKQPTDRKKLKKVKYISEGIFRQLVDGASFTEIQAVSRELNNKTALCLPDEIGALPDHIRDDYESIWKVERRPQVTLSRTDQTSTLYHTGRTSFNRGCGLWFGVLWLDAVDKFVQQLNAAFLELGDAGIGGERSRGYGACKIHPQGNLEFPDRSTSQPWVSLSRYLPKKPPETGALEDERAAYRIDTVGGWVTSTVDAAQRRRPVNLLVEGSVLGPLDTPTPGQMVDIQPDYGGTRPLGHPVWRNGFALAVGVQSRRDL